MECQGRETLNFDSGAMYDLGGNKRFDPRILKQPPLPVELANNRGKHGFIEKNLHRPLHEVAKFLGRKPELWSTDKDVLMWPYWRAWWDWYKHSPEEFWRDCLFVITKDGDLIPALDINYSKFKRAQRRYYGRLMRQMRDLGYVRMVVLKSRQIGSTTMCNGFTFHGTMFTPNQRHITLADDKKKSEFITRYVRDWITHESGLGLPDWLRPKLDYKAQDHLKFNGFEMLPVQTMSEYFVATADEAAGRSYGLRSVLGTEVAYWGRRGQEAVLGIKNTVSRTPNTVVLWESTGQGIGGAFYDECRLAEQSLSGYDFLFIPWYLVDEYRFERDDPELRHFFGYGDQELRLWENAFEAKLWTTPGLDLDLDEMHLVTLAQDALDPYQILWRRWAIRNLCNNDLDKFRQEYPATPKEAFIGSGQPVFWQAYLLEQLEIAEREALRCERGELVEA